MAKVYIRASDPRPWTGERLVALVNMLSRALGPDVFYPTEDEAIIANNQHDPDGKDDHRTVVVEITTSEDIQ